jgi:hypothetical protein
MVQTDTNISLGMYKMKWKTKKKYNLGEKIIIKRFALFPIKLDNGITIWLEFYKELFVMKEFLDKTPYYQKLKTYQDKR